MVVVMMMMVMMIPNDSAVPFLGVKSNQLGGVQKLHGWWPAHR